MNANPSMAPRLRSLAIEASRIEDALAKKLKTLDKYLDFHNMLNAWLLNTEHDQAALEVIALMNQYLDVSKHSTRDRMVDTVDLVNND